jgi:hypothetical protein
VYNYIYTYDTQIKKLPEPAFENLQAKFEALRSRYLRGDKDSVGFAEFIHEAGDMCR